MSSAQLHQCLKYILLGWRYWSGRKYILQVMDTRAHLCTGPSPCLNHCPTSSWTNNYFVNSKSVHQSINGITIALVGSNIVFAVFLVYVPCTHKSMRTWVSWMNRFRSTNVATNCLATSEVVPGIRKITHNNGSAPERYECTHHTAQRQLNVLKDHFLLWCAILSYMAPVCQCMLLWCLSLWRSHDV